MFINSILRLCLIWLLDRDQVRQDYISGNLVILRHGELTDDLLTTIIQLAAYQMKANDQVQLPTQ